MGNPKRTFIACLIGLAIGAVLMRASILGSLGPDEGTPATVAGIGGLVVLLSAGYFAVRSGLATWRLASLQRESNVIARWVVPPATWQQFCEIGLTQTGVDLPGLDSLMFFPRPKEGAQAVPVVCGKRAVQIGGRIFSVAPGRGTGMEEAGMIRTQPPCVALVIARPVGAPRAPRIARSLLLLPIASGADGEAHRAIRYYDEAVASVRDVGDIARANPVLAKTLFWAVMVISALAAAVGIWLETSDYPGNLPGALGITGIMVGLGTLVIGLVFRARR